MNEGEDMDEFDMNEREDTDWANVIADAFPTILFVLACVLMLCSGLNCGCSISVRSPQTTAKE